MLLLAAIATPSPAPTPASGSPALTTWLNVVSTIAAVFAAFFAWRAVAASKDATGLARETVKASKETASYARQTAEVGKTAHEAAERDRTRWRLREIGAMVEEIQQQADALRMHGQVRTLQERDTAARWRSPMQNVLAQAVAGFDLPECRELAEALGADQAYGAAGRARSEIDRRLEELDQAG